MKYIKYLTIVLVGLVMVSFTSNQKQRKIKQAAKASFGHVQLVREVSFHAVEDSSGNISKGTIISDTDFIPLHNEIREDMVTPPVAQPVELWIYDEYGDEIRNEKRHANGNIASIETHAYYDNGDLKELIDSVYPYRTGIPNVHIQQNLNKYDASGSLLVSDKWEYYAANRSNPRFTRIANFYDSIGKLREAMTFNMDTIDPAIVIWKTYNEKGKLVETDERRRNGNMTDLTPFEKIDFWYDKKGRIYDKATYHPNKGLVKDEKTIYDSTGKTITIYSYTTGRVLMGTVVKRIINTTNTIQEDTYDGDGFLTDYTISHDSAKHMMDKGVFHITYQKVMGADHRYHNAEPGDTEMVHHIINDSHFNMVEGDDFSTTRKPISQTAYQYTYDSIGNWIAKIQFNNDNPVRITEREIVYFKD